MLRSIGLQRVGYDLTSEHTHTQALIKWYQLNYFVLSNHSFTSRFGHN